MSLLLSEIMLVQSVPKITFQNVVIAVVVVVAVVMIVVVVVLLFFVSERRDIRGTLFANAE